MKTETIDTLKAIDTDEIRKYLKAVDANETASRLADAIEREYSDDNSSMYIAFRNAVSEMTGESWVGEETAVAYVVDVLRTKSICLD